MSEVQDFKAYVSLYEGLKERYKSIRVEGSMDHEIFEMEFIEPESNGWIPRFIKSMNERVILTFSKEGVDYAYDQLHLMEEKLNTISSTAKRHFY